jgi:hypothetical protein
MSNTAETALNSFGASVSVSDVWCVDAETEKFCFCFVSVVWAPLYQRDLPSPPLLSPPLPRKARSWIKTLSGDACTQKHGGHAEPNTATALARGSNHAEHPTCLLLLLLQGTEVASIASHVWLQLNAGPVWPATFPVAFGVTFVARSSVGRRLVGRRSRRRLNPAGGGSVGGRQSIRRRREAVARRRASIVRAGPRS